MEPRPELERIGWTRPLALGTWCSVASVWPITFIQIGEAHAYQPLVIQPLLLVTLVALAASQSRKEGWRRAAGQSLWFFLVIGLAGWLPTNRYHLLAANRNAYSDAYGVYLWTYETMIAAFIGFQASAIASASFNRDSVWRRPLIVAPLLMVVTARYNEDLPHVLPGLLLGVFLPWIGIWRRIPGTWLPTASRATPYLLFAAACSLAYGAALYLYTQAPSGFPSASDDGIHYFRIATQMANDPGAFLSARLDDENYFSGYSVAMASWFMLVGIHMPSWLLWHGLACGALAVAVYYLGTKLCGRAVAIAAALWVTAHNVLLHLFATLNMETFFVPLLYVSVALWVSAVDLSDGRHRSRVMLAGVALGAATIVRPTSLLLPLWLIAVTFFERADGPKSTATSRAQQLRWLLTPFALLLTSLLIRNRVAWGYWTLSGVKGVVSSLKNTALAPHGEHLVTVGVARWAHVLWNEPALIWNHVLPGLWLEFQRLWIRPGFGTIDLVRGLNYPGPYQGVLNAIIVAAVLVGATSLLTQRTRTSIVLLMLPLYFSSLVLGFYVLNARYRAPFIPALILIACAAFNNATHCEHVADKTDHGRVGS